MDNDYSKMSTEELEKLLVEYEDIAGKSFNTQMALKLSICSVYGALGSKGFFVYNPELAKSVTGNGRFYINLLSQRINEHLRNIDGKDHIVYNDTDSVYLTLKDVLKKKNLLAPTKQETTDRIDKFVEDEIQPVINGASQEVGDIFNAYDSSVIQAKREVISDRAVFLAKKRYFMNVIDNEGVRFYDPHVKTMGIELVRSSTPAFSKKYLKEAIDIILYKDEKELKEYLNDVKSKYDKADLMDLGKTSSVSNLNYKIGDKGIPVNSRAAIASNNYIYSKNLQNVHQPLVAGEKLKMLYLRTPNPLGQNIFAFNTEKFAQEFKDYIDYDTNWEKFFLEPLKIMTAPLRYNLKTEVQSILDEW